MPVSRPHLSLLLRLHPRSSAWSLDPDKAPYQELEAWAEVLDAQDAQVDALLAELLPDQDTALLSRWEALYDLHRTSGLTTLARRRRVLARMSYLPDTRPATIESVLGRLMDQTVTVVEPGPFRCDDPGSLCDTASDVIDGAFCWWVEVDEALARVGDVTRDELEEEVSRLKPAHTVACVRTDDFRCDDPWSLTDRDLLGA